MSLGPGARCECAVGRAGEGKHCEWEDVARTDLVTGLKGGTRGICFFVSSCSHNTHQP